MTKIYVYVHIWHGIEQIVRKWELDPSEHIGTTLAIARTFAFTIKAKYPKDDISIGLLKGRTTMAKWDVDVATDEVINGVLRFLWD